MGKISKLSDEIDSLSPELKKAVTKAFEDREPLIIENLELKDTIKELKKRISDLTTIVNMRANGRQLKVYDGKMFR